MGPSEDLQGLPDKGFDQIFDETRAQHPGLSDEKIRALVSAKMEIRQRQHEEREYIAYCREQIASIAVDDRLYEGWKAFRLAEGETTGLSRDDFEKNLAYLRRYKPDVFLRFHPFWVEATSDAVSAVRRMHTEFDAVISEFRRRFDEAMQGEMGAKMVRFIETMSKDKAAEEE